MFASLLGLQRGLQDERSAALTEGLPAVAAYFGVLFAAVEMVVPAAILHDGEAVDRVDAQMKRLAGLERLPRIELHPKGAEILDTAVHGGLAVRPRLVLYYEHPVVPALIGHLVLSSSPARTDLDGFQTCSRIRARYRSTASR